MSLFQNYRSDPQGSNFTRKRTFGSEVASGSLGCTFCVFGKPPCLCDCSFQVGDMVSIIDMPKVEETMWWRGKKGFEVSQFSENACKHK